MEAKQSMVLHLSKIGKVRALPHAWKVVIFPVVSTSLLSPALRLSPLSPALHRQCYGQNQYSQEKKKKEEGIFLARYYMSCMRKTVCGKDRNATVLIRERLGGRDTRRSERVRMMVQGCVKQSLMEMDLTRVEIRWGNCEKMADVLTKGWSYV